MLLRPVTEVQLAGSGNATQKWTVGKASDVADLDLMIAEKKAKDRDG